MLKADFTVRLGEFEVTVNLTAGEGEVVAIVGPNGAGKTTMLRALAGLVPIEAGRIELGGRVLNDSATGVNIPPEHRRIGFAFQDYLLFPHLSALDNVAYGLRATGASKAKARLEAQYWLERFGLSDEGGNKPHALSGGQSQRVALARALAIKPALLALDEPLAAVDPPQRPELRRLMRSALNEHSGTQLLVTHDPVDALASGDRVAVLERGRLTQVGTVAEVAAQPRSRWVAELVGVNLYHGESADGRFTLDNDGGAAGTGQMLPGAGPRRFAVVTEARGRAMAVIHPRAVTLHRVRPEGSARNVWTASVDGVDEQNERARVRIGGVIPIVAEVTPAAAAELGLAQGVQVWISVKATEISVFEE
ncbi:MAG: ABC transporter ATP-binding protein [Actinomycetota bacterium]